MTPTNATTAALLALVALPAAADITGGSITIFDPPAQTGNNNQQVNVLLGFNELQQVTLTEDLVLNAATIAAGSRVSSHYIIYDPPGGSSSITGNATFDGDVLAILTERNDLNATDALFGQPATQYLSPNFRGLEAGDEALLGQPNEVLFNLTAGSPGDYVRVLTVAIPAPSAAALAAIALAAPTRRRR